MTRFACLTASLAVLVAGSAQADSITLNPNMIANVQSGNGPSNGGGPILIQPSPDNNQGLLSFDVSSIRVPVTGATLKVYQMTNIFDGPPPLLVGGPAGSYDIYRNTSAWQQDTVTWNTKPSIDPASVATVPLSHFATGWQSWDVTSLANAWITGQHANFGLTIGRSDPGTPEVFLVTGPMFLPLPNAAALAGPLAFDANPFLPELILDSNPVAATPEPASMVMAGMAALALIGCRRRRLMRAAA